MIERTRREIVAGGSTLATIGAVSSSRAVDAAAVVRSVSEYGAAGDGQDQTGLVQKAYDDLASRGGGTLFFPAGVYAIALRLTSRDVHLRGAGAGATRLVPAQSDQPILTAFYRNGAQTAAYVSDLQLEGLGSLQSTLFLAGADSYERNVEFSGGTHFERVRFHNADISIKRRFGSIVLVVDQCTFTDANFHIHSSGYDGARGGEAMHAGCVSVSRSRLLGFRKAMFYINGSIQGTGQVVFSQNIVENGSGFVFYFDRFVATGVPAIMIRDQWNEKTADGQHLEIAGSVHRNAAFLYAKGSTVPILVENTPLSSVCLERSSLTTQDCDLTAFTYEGDAASSVTHERAYAFSGTTQGVCRTIAGPSLAAGLRTPWFSMPLPVGRSGAFGAAVIQRFDGTEPIQFFSASRSTITRPAGEAAVAGAAQDLVLRAGEPLATQSFAVRPERWLMISYIARIVSGGPVDVQVNGMQGMSGPARIAGTEWVRLVGIVEVPTASPTQYLLHSAEQSTTIRIGGIAVIDFAGRQQAIDYANSGYFPS